MPTVGVFVGVNITNIGNHIKAVEGKNLPNIGSVIIDSDAS